MNESMKELVRLLIEQSPPDEIWTLYRDLQRPDVCEYIENNYMI